MSLAQFFTDIQPYHYVRFLTEDGEIKAAFIREKKGGRKKLMRIFEAAVYHNKMTWQEGDPEPWSDVCIVECEMKNGLAREFMVLPMEIGMMIREVKGRPFREWPAKHRMELGDWEKRLIVMDDKKDATIFDMGRGK